MLLDQMIMMSEKRTGQEAQGGGEVWGESHAVWSGGAGEAERGEEGRAKRRGRGARGGGTGEEEGGGAKRGGGVSEVARYVAIGGCFVQGCARDEQ